MVSISRELIPIKVLYFLYYGGLASFMPYKSIFQKQLGMSSTQNGIIQAIMQLVSLFSPPLAGYITDRTKAYKAMLTSLFFFSIIFTIPFYFVPPVEREPPQTINCCFLQEKAQLACPTNAAFVNSSNCVQNTNATLVLDSDSMEDCISSNISCSAIITETKEVFGSTFVILIILTALMSFFLAPVTPLVDSSAMDTLGTGNVKNFGVQRMWGAVGFGILGLAVGYFTDQISPEEIYGQYSKNYSLAVGSAGLFWGLAMAVMLLSVNISAPKAKSVRSGMGKLLQKAEIVAFLFVVLICGFSTGVQYAFLFWYLLELKGFGQYILGLSVLVTCLSEIPMFWFSGWICRKLGYVTVFTIGLCAVSIRFFTYTIITEAWQVLLVEWLHGISFALPTAAMCSYAAIMAPKDAVATLISISQAVYWGIGNLLGALLGGILYNSFGGITLFRISCVVCLVTAAFYWISFGQYGMYFRFSVLTVEGKDKAKAEEKAVIVDDAPEQELLQKRTEANGVHEDTDA